MQSTYEKNIKTIFLHSFLKTVPELAVIAPPLLVEAFQTM